MVARSLQSAARSTALPICLALLAFSACGTSPGTGDSGVDPDAADAGDATHGDTAGDTGDTSPSDVADTGDSADGDDTPDAPDTTPVCIDWDSPLNQRIANTPAECADIAIVCSGGEAFGDACGCGCRYEPPTCPDPADPDVSYVGTSPEACSVIDFDCAADSFGGPCGCGCIACPSAEAPNVSYVSRDPAECADIDFDCGIEGFSAFDSPFCGCGCEYGDCRTEKIFGTSGMAEPFRAGSRCEFLIVCSTEPLAANGLRELIGGFYADARCGDGSAFGCPDGTVSFCEPYIETVDAVDIAAACSASRVDSVHRILCGGDL